MKSVAILTFHNACNYGAFLQAYALMKTLQSFPDTDAYILDYQANAIKNAYQVREIMHQKGKAINKAISMILRMNDIKKRNAMFRKMQDQCFRFKRRGLNRSELASVVDDYDAFIVGSDQVWNLALTSYDETFLLDFVNEPLKKYSYSASIGNEKIPDRDSEILSMHLKEFHRLSVRETGAAMALKDLLKREISVHIDPVFLFPMREWIKLARKQTERDDQNYILLFVMGISKREKYLVELAEEIAQKSGLPVVYLTDQERWFKYRQFIHAGIITPQEFITFIMNAKLVITNSFHGTAFSILMHTDFLVDTGVARNVRIKNLLNLVGLEKNGICAENKDVSINTISENQWKMVDDAISCEREKAMSFLADIISEIHKGDEQR